MKKIFTFLSACLISSTILNGTPTSIFWTNCTTDVQPAQTLHFGVNNTFALINRTHRPSSLPVDVGLTYGLFSWDGLNCEIGVDYFPQKYPFTFNGKIGIEEGRFFIDSPSVSVGVFNAGTKIGKTNQNVFDLILGMSLPESIGGRFFIGGYRGNKSLGPVQTGFMAAFQYPFMKIHDAVGSFDRWLFEADYCSGKNAIGGASVAVRYNFTKHVSLSMGPVWFIDKKINGPWKWAIQFDASMF